MTDPRHASASLFFYAALLIVLPVLLSSHHASAVVFDVPVQQQQHQQQQQQPAPIQYSLHRHATRITEQHVSIILPLCSVSHSCKYGP